MNKEQIPEHLQELVGELDEKPQEEFKEWLRKSLAGHIALPKAMPDDEPWDILSDLDRYVTDAARRNLDEAIDELLRETIREIEECAQTSDTETQNIQQHEILVPLLRVIVNLDRRSLDGQLAQLVRNQQAFFQLDANTRQRVLTALVDLRSPQSESFWKDVCISDPGVHGGIAFAALAAHNLISALELLPHIPENSSALDAIFDVHLPLAWEACTTDEIREARRTLGAVLPECRPGVGDAIQTFGEEHGINLERQLSKSETEDQSIGWEKFDANIDEILSINSRSPGPPISPNVTQPQHEIAV